jgi:hypothetical protein
VGTAQFLGRVELLLRGPGVLLLLARQVLPPRVPEVLLLLARQVLPPRVPEVLLPLVLQVRLPLGPKVSLLLVPVGLQPQGTVGLQPQGRGAHRRPGQRAVLPRDRAAHLRLTDLNTNEMGVSIVLNDLRQRQCGLKIVSCATFLMAIVWVEAAQAQSYTSANTNWSSSWGFASPADRQIAQQRAQMLYQMRNGNPSSVVNNTTYNNVTTDNRNNYVEQTGAGSVEFVGEDKIGQNTNSIGAMNTGSTNIEINGSNNLVTATNSSDSDGCVDGSIQTASGASTYTTPTGGIDISIASSTSALRCR